MQYALAEADAFEGDRVLVVGGGDSAVEAALALSEVRGTAVGLSYRRDRFSRIKPANRERIEASLGGGRIEVHWTTTVQGIHADRVSLTSGQRHTYQVCADQIFIFAGGELPTAFLRSSGVEIDTHFGTPR